MADDFLRSYKGDNFEVLVNQYLPNSNRFQESKARSRSPVKNARIPVECPLPEETSNRLRAVMEQLGLAQAEEAPTTAQPEATTAEPQHAAEHAEPKQSEQAAQYAEPNNTAKQSEQAAVQPQQVAQPANQEDPPTAVQLRLLLDEFRRSHNEDRGGRNAVYWAVRKQYGEEAAKPFYVPKGQRSTAPMPDAKYAMLRVAPPPPAVQPKSSSTGILTINPPPPPAVRR